MTHLADPAGAPRESHDSLPPRPAGPSTRAPAHRSAMARRRRRLSLPSDRERRLRELLASEFRALTDSQPPAHFGLGLFIPAD